jgi:hypothetical protein
MLGVFLTENPTAVPAGAVAFLAEHAWGIRELLGHRDFAEAETDVCGPDVRLRGGGEGPLRTWHPGRPAARGHTG